MTAPIRSLESSIVADIRTVGDLIEGLRAAKAMRNVSNKWCDDIGWLADGQTDKVLGPSGAKGLSPFLFGMYHRLFAVRLVMVVDPDMERIMRPKWEGRDVKQVRVETGRVSKKLIERTRPLVFEELSELARRNPGAVCLGSLLKTLGSILAPDPAAIEAQPQIESPTAISPAPAPAPALPAPAKVKVVEAPRPRSTEPVSRAHLRVIQERPKRSAAGRR